MTPSQEQRYDTLRDAAVRCTQAIGSDDLEILLGALGMAVTLLFHEMPAPTRYPRARAWMQLLAASLMTPDDADEPSVH